MIPKRPSPASKQIFASILVIALTSVIATATSLSPEPITSAAGQSTKPVAAAADVKPEVKMGADLAAKSEVESAIAPAAESKASEQSAGKLAAPEEAQQVAKTESDGTGKRKARADESKSSPPSDSKTESKAADTKATPEPSKTAETKATSKTAPTKSQTKAAPTKSRLPANLGTVTSTGSGGASHYMSKHDAYSAIAEKHGALAQDAMRKSDKRHIQGGFGGIQKASGLGDMLSPFKGVTDSGLARSASMRSIMKGKYSVPAYVASALLGAVALMAFYESPISPLPVPPLPEPPVGRFPPEMPNIQPGAQVPFRTNQQQYYQNYNQRSLNQPQVMGNQQQVYFPGGAGQGQQMAQQRQMSVAGPAAQLAANLLSVSKPQNAQRKSSPDYDSSGRSFFGSGPLLQGSAGNINKMSGPANQQVGQKQGGGFLSFFGLGGQSGDSGATQAAGSSGQGPSQQASSLPIQSQSGSGSLIEPKGQAAAMSNSHLVNKVKSLFTRSPPTSSSSSSVSNANANPYDQYQRMSLVQAFMKDTAFIPGFLSPLNRKSSPANPATASSANKNQQQSSNVAPSARMQSGPESQLASQVLGGKAKASTNSGYGLAKVAHALLETFTSNDMQRSASPSGQASADGLSRKSTSEEQPASPMALISDIVSSYSGQSGDNLDQKLASQPQPQQQQASAASSQQAEQSKPTARSSEISSEEEHRHSQPDSSAQQVPADGTKQQQQVAANPTEQAHVRKTRSIGLEYPMIQSEPEPSRATKINNLIDYVADSYTQNRLLFNFVMNQVGLSHAVPYVEQMLASGPSESQQ